MNVFTKTQNTGNPVASWSDVLNELEVAQTHLAKCAGALTRLDNSDVRAWVYDAGLWNKVAIDFIRTKLIDKPQSP